MMMPRRKGGESKREREREMGDRHRAREIWIDK